MMTIKDKERIRATLYYAAYIAIEIFLRDIEAYDEWEEGREYAGWG